MSEVEFYQALLQLMDEQNQHNETRAEKHRLTKRALKAETEAATFKALVESAVELIERDYPLGAKHSFVRVRHFLQRAHAVLGDTEPDFDEIFRHSLSDESGLPGEE